MHLQAQDWLPQRQDDVLKSSAFLWGTTLCLFSQEPCVVTVPPDRSYSNEWDGCFFSCRAEVGLNAVFISQLLTVTDSNRISLVRHVVQTTYIISIRVIMFVPPPALLPDHLKMCGFALKVTLIPSLGRCTAMTHLPRVCVRSFFLLTKRWS